MLNLMHQASPFKHIRHFLPSYFFTQAKTDTSRTSVYFRRTPTDNTTNKPPHDAHLLLIPICDALHWYLLIRKGTTYTYMDSFDHNTTPCQTKHNHLSIIKNTPAHIPHPTLPATLSCTPGFKQHDPVNCGTYLLIHAYVYLFHPQPHIYHWHTSKGYRPSPSRSGEVLTALLGKGGLTLFPPQSGVPDWDPPRLQRSSLWSPETDVKASDRLYGPGDGIPRV